MSTRTSRAGQEGIALVAAIFVGVILIILATLIMSVSMIETNQSSRQVYMSSAAQAAEAGVDDYISKLTQNPSYPLQWVHPAERQRTATTSAAKTAGGFPWSGAPSWTYAANAPVTWRKLTNGYEYSLRVKPPKPGETGVTVYATGRKIGSTKYVRTYEATLRTASVLDYQMMIAGNGYYASTATTNGKIYVGGDISHPGIAQADVFGEKKVLATPTLQNGAQFYASSAPYQDIRSKIPQPIDFTQFQVQTSVLRDAAQAGGIYLNGGGAKAWRLKFRPDGNVEVYKCTDAAAGTTRDSILHYYAIAQRTCAPAAPAVRPVPANGAIFAEQFVMTYGTINGRATIGSNSDIMLEGPMNYVNGLDDTIGYIPAIGFNFAYYAKENIPSGSIWEWWGSLLVSNPNVTWWVKTDAAGAGPPGITQMITHGSAVTPFSGNISVIPSRIYKYDPNLQFLMPPYFPLLDHVYTVDSFREIPTQP